MPPSLVSSVTWPRTTRRPEVTRALADTSLFIARESSRPLAQLQLPDELAISVITVGELRAGVLAAADLRTRDLRLAALTEALAFDALPIDQAAVEAWALLRILLRDRGLRCR